jgi:hypothetical protein
MELRFGSEDNPDGRTARHCLISAPYRLPRLPRLLNNRELRIHQSEPTNTRVSHFTYDPELFLRNSYALDRTEIILPFTGKELDVITIFKLASQCHCWRAADNNLESGHGY